MSVLLNPEQTQPITGLGTWTCTVSAAGQYKLSCVVTSLPAGSGLQIALRQNGSGGTTVSSPSSTQTVAGASYIFTCAASDVLTCVLSSSNAVDSQANAIKGTITLCANYGE